MTSYRDLIERRYSRFYGESYPQEDPTERIVDEIRLHRKDIAGLKQEEVKWDDPIVLRMRYRQELEKLNEEEAERRRNTVCQFPK